tara:strand:+ start:487257 stop:487658 length:402 start_codon:yes stop_codon:yes gene_type:complete
MALTLEDKLELHEMAHRYGDIIDDKDWAALGRIFTEDAVFEVVNLVTMTGLADIRRYMREEGRHPLAHLITNVYVEASPSGVRLCSRGVFPVNSSGGGAGHRVFYGSYYDEVVRTQEGWRVRHRIFSTHRLPQ